MGLLEASDAAQKRLNWKLGFAWCYKLIVVDADFGLG